MITATRTSAPAITLSPLPLPQENHADETVVITSSPTEMVYIRACKNCQFRSQTKIAKCIIGEGGRGGWGREKEGEGEGGSEEGEVILISGMSLSSPESCSDVKVAFEDAIMSGTLVSKLHDHRDWAHLTTRITMP